MSHEKYVDEETGATTTGHVWDGDVREWNKPLPKWWLYTFYASILWAIGYCVFYPSFPGLTTYAKGTLGYSQRAAVTSEVAAERAKQDVYRTKIETATLADIKKDPDLARFAQASGKAAFDTNCAPCHGRGAQGAVGYPNLNDDDWLWGGSLQDIEQTITHGIRSTDKDTRTSQMPHFGTDGILKPEEIDQVSDYVLSLSKLPSDAAKAEKGGKIFAEQCAACHGEKGTGNQEMGAPNLTDGIWLYGNSKAAVTKSIETGRGGVMPAWGDRFDKATLKSLAVYVHSLGGGTVQKAAMEAPAPAPAPAKAAAEAPKPAAPAAAAPGRATFALPGGPSIEYASDGVEAKIIGFLNDKAAPIDNKVWFDFDHLNFETASASLTSESKDQVARIAAILKAYPAAKAKIGGYTDNQGDPEKNLKLSDARANKVREELIALGIAGDRLEAEGYGEQHPVGDNATAEGRAKNRRTAISIRAK